MAEKRVLQEEIITQCCAFFTRETKHWARLAIKKIPITNEEYLAKKEIIEAVFRVAAAAVMKMDQLEDQKMWKENLNFDYRELQMEIDFYSKLMEL